MPTLLEEVTHELKIGPQELLRWEREGKPPMLFEGRGPLNPGDPNHDQWMRAVMLEKDFLIREINRQFSDERRARRLLKDLAGPKLDGLPGMLSGGSFITGTSVELLFSSVTTGTQLATFTTEDSLQKTIPAFIIPAGYFYNMSATGKSLRYKMIGRLGTTGAPTFTWSIRLITTPAWAATGVVVSSAALTAGTTQTLAPFVIDVEVVARAIVAGTTGLTVAILGEVRSPLGLASPFAGTIPTNNTAFTVTVDPAVSQYIFASAACGTSNAANLIQSELIKLYGEN